MTAIKKYASLVFKIVVAIGLVWWIEKKGLLNLGAFKSISFFSAAFGVFLIFLNVAINNYRWTFLLNAQRFPVKAGETLPLTLIGLFFNFAMPGGVGGDVVKGYYLLRGQNERKLDAAMSILVDRVIGLFTMAFMALVAMLFHLEFLKEHPELLALLWLLIGLVLGVLFFLRLAFSETLDRLKTKAPWIPQSVIRIWDAFHSYRHVKSVLFKAVVVSLISQAFSILFFIFLNSQIGGGMIPAGQLLWLVPVGLISTSLPISPGGIGVGQAIFLILFKWTLGHDADVGPNLITGYQIAQLLIGMVGIYFYVRMKNKDKSERQSDHIKNL